MVYFSLDLKFLPMSQKPLGCFVPMINDHNVSFDREQGPLG
jgi:hypothetical protein